MDAGAPAASLSLSSAPSAPVARPANLTSAPPPVDAGKGVQAFLLQFTRVQYLLDQNRLLLHEINLNQESKIPENITRNVVLINELNDNVLKVVELYARISDSCESFGAQTPL